MEKRLVLVALVTLALGCGETQGVTDDAGSDAEAVDLGGLDVAVDDAGDDAGEDAGWCLDSPCIQRLNFGGGVCIDNVRTDFPCDDDDERTYDDRCSAVGVCEGTACECDSGPCCDGCHTLPIGTVCEWGYPYPAGLCIQVPGESRVRCSVTP